MAVVVLPSSHQLILLFLLSPLLLLRWTAEASPPGITFDDVSAEDYSMLAEQESTKPDDVDNEVIQSLVDNFLNKGSAVGEGSERKEKGTAPEKFNKQAQALVNSSDFWRTTSLEPQHSISDAGRIQSWLAGYSADLQRVLQQIAQAGWNYFTTASYSTKQYLDEAEEVGRAFLRASASQSAQFNASAFPLGSPERVQLSVLAQQGMNALEAADLEEFNRQLLAINQQFTHTQLCGEPGKAPVGGDKTTCLLKFSDMPSLLGGPSADATQCLELWQKWRVSAGGNLTASYAQLVQLSNKGAQLNGFSDAGAMWRAVYELPKQFGFYPERQLDLEQQMDQLYGQLKPLYEQLMAYFRPRLAAIHSKKGNEENQKAGLVPRDGPLPIHLLKSQNGDAWAAYYEQTRPFGEEMPAEEQKIVSDLMDSFHGQNYTVRLMFSKVYRFMKHLGFERLPRTFWTNSVFTRNWAKDMICQPATAYDMMDGQDDYRIKICGQLSEQDFVNAHRLMAKLYGQYGSRKQPILLRDMPNPSLSSALAGAFSVVALNPDYLRAQKLVGEHSERNGPAEINRLYKEALEELVKLPFAIVADKWRYAVFQGRLNAANWSQEWWTLRQKYQGITAPPMADPKAVEFDAVASPAISQMHAPASRDALAYIAQFQVLKKLCGGISQLSQGCLPNKSALESVHEAIAKGGSISWLDAFEKLTGSKQLDAGPMLEYFEPLLDWLRNANENEQRVIGWAGTRGEPFPENELPELHSQYQNENSFGTGSGLGFGSSEGGEHVAFPGKSCEKGQECLLDSQCNGSICVCRDGLFTLKIADTYNCVPGDPAKVGFTDDNGGLVIALNPNNETSASADQNGAAVANRKEEEGKKDGHNNRHQMDSGNGGDSKMPMPSAGCRPSSFTCWLLFAPLILLVAILRILRI